MASVRIPPILRPEAGGHRELQLPGQTVGEVLEALVTAYPALRQRILPNGELPEFLNVFADGSDIRLAQGLDTAVGDTTPVLLLPAVAGGGPQHG